jgi:hypothetical protein
MNALMIVASAAYNKSKLVGMYMLALPNGVLDIVRLPTLSKHQVGDLANYTAHTLPSSGHMNCCTWYFIKKILHSHIHSNTYNVEVNKSPFQFTKMISM